MKRALLTLVLALPCVAQQGSLVDYLSQVKNRPNVMGDNNRAYANLAAACADAITYKATLSISKIWRSQQTQSCAANIQFDGGIIQPASGQTVTFTGSFIAPLAQAFDLSLGGTVVPGPTPQYYPQWWGAKGDGATDDTAAIRSAVAAACRSVPAQVAFAAATYLLATPNTITSQVCDGLHLTGLGFPILNYTATSGAFLTNTGHRNLSVHGLQVRGTNLGGTYFVLHAPGASERDCEYFDNYILYFGNGSTGAGIQINSDSGNLRIHDNVMGNLTANIRITQPTDTLDIFNNTLSTPGTSPGGPNRCVDISGENGAATIRIQHNNMTCEGAGAVRVQGPGGAFIVTHNESETLLPFTNASNAAFEFLGAITVYAVDNLANTHSQAGGNYSFYVDDLVTNSDFAHNEAVGFLTKGIRVGSGTANTYDNNIASTGVSTLYSANYIGIRQPDSGGSPGVANGCAYSSDKNFSFCSPDASLGAFQGNSTVRSTTNPAVNLKTGVDSAAGSNGRAWVQATHDGVTTIPQQLNPNGGGVSLNGTATNSGLVEITGNATQTGTMEQTTSNSAGSSLNNLTDTAANFVGSKVTGDAAVVVSGTFKTGYVGGPLGTSGTLSHHPYVLRSNDIERMRITADGDIILAVQPVSCAGKPANTIWNDAGVLKLCP